MIPKVSHLPPNPKPEEGGPVHGESLVDKLKSVFAKLKPAPKVETDLSTGHESASEILAATEQNHNSSTTSKPVFVPEPQSQDDAGSRPIGQPTMPKVPPPSSSMANVPRPPPVRIPDPPSFLVSDDVDLMTGEPTKTFDLNRMNDIIVADHPSASVDDEKTPVVPEPENFHASDTFAPKFEADFETLARDADDRFDAVAPVEDFSPQSFESNAHKFEQAEEEKSRQEEKPVVRKYPPPPPPSDHFEGISFAERIAHIEKLGELRDKGYLTDDEFTAEKKKLLAS